MRLASILVILAIAAAAGGCVHTRSPHPLCSDLAGVSGRVETYPVWTQPTNTKSPAYVVTGVYVVPTGKVVPVDPPILRCW